MDVTVGDHPDGATVEVRVVPRAPRSAVTGRHGGAVKVAVAAPPVDGAANAEVCRFLARLVGVRRSAAEVLVGASRRDKVVLLRGVAAADVRDALRRAAP